MNVNTCYWFYQEWQFCFRSELIADRHRRIVAVIGFRDKCTETNSYDISKNDRLMSDICVETLHCPDRERQAKYSIIEITLLPTELRVYSQCFNP